MTAREVAAGGFDAVAEWVATAMEAATEGLATAAVETIGFGLLTRGEGADVEGFTATPADADAV